MTDLHTLEIFLLVDPDPLQRSVVARYLRECGYRVIEATDDTEALAVMTT